MAHLIYFTPVTSLRELCMNPSHRGGVGSCLLRVGSVSINDKGSLRHTLLFLELSRADGNNGQRRLCCCGKIWLVILAYVLNDQLIMCKRR
jgi:hypothetical protein